MTLKVWATKERKKVEFYIKTDKKKNIFCALKDTTRKSEKVSHRIKRKYLCITYLIRDLYLKNSYNSTLKRTNNIKMKFPHIINVW
jgi:hypothetical protein